MDERLTPGDTRRAKRQTAGFVAVVLLLAIGIPAALLAAAPSCACVTPPDLVVLNYARDDATVSWQGSGPLGLPVLGISGSAPVPACSTVSLALRPGHVSISVSVAGAAQTVPIIVPEGQARDGHSATLTIAANGRISGPTDGAPVGGYPPDPLCD